MYSCFFSVLNLFLIIRKLQTKLVGILKYYTFYMHSILFEQSNFLRAKINFFPKFNDEFLNNILKGY